MRVRETLCLGLFCQIESHIFFSSSTLSFDQLSETRENRHFCIGIFVVRPVQRFDTASMCVVCFILCEEMSHPFIKYALIFYCNLFNVENLILTHRKSIDYSNAYTIYVYEVIGIDRLHYGRMSHRRRVRSSSSPSSLMETHKT